MKKVLPILMVLGATFMVTSCDQEVTLQSFTMSEASKEVYVGSTAQLSVDIVPVTAKSLVNITWSSSNTAVASISNTGLVTGLTSGNTTITASAYNGKYTTTCELKVKDLTFKLSSSSVSMKPGDTHQLSTTVTPSTGNNYAVTWSSSNNTIATVSQTGLVTTHFVGNAVISASILNGKYTATCNVTVKELDAWTIMIYMCGSDLESDKRSGGLATADIKEILSVANQPDDVNIILETGGAKSWKSTYSISKDKLERWHVKNKQLVKDGSYTYASMGEKSTFQSFLEWGLTTYPAEKTGVILWNHGGAMSGVCFDEKSDDDSLLNSEVQSALRSVFPKLDIKNKLEFIGYDACLMQDQDIAEFNSEFFKYMVASQEAESGYGWDYDNWVDNLYKKESTETILKEICDSFIKDNDDTGYANDQTLSYLDLSKMSDYKEAFENLANALSGKITSSNKKSFGNLVKSAKTFAVDGDNSQYYYGLYDVKDFLNKLSNNSTFNPGSNYITEVINARNELVKYSKAGSSAGNANGLSLVWGISSYAQQMYVAAETNFTKWQKLSDTYGGTVNL